MNTQDRNFVIIDALPKKIDYESTTTRKASGLDLPASGGFTAKGGKRQGREVPQSLKTTR